MVVDVQKDILKELQEKIEVIKSCLNKNEIVKNIEVLKNLQEEDGFWNDIKHAEKVNKQLKDLEKKLDVLNEIDIEYTNIIALIELLEMEDDEEMFAELTKELKIFKNFINEKFLYTLLNDKHDGLNAILTIHSGAGGTESQDWANMLFRMYVRYCERMNFKLKVLDIQEGDVVGLKGITFLIEGENAYGYLKCEKGVHRLVRISPFDSGARRHTSFASLEVVPEIEDDNEIIIKPDDLKIDTYRSSGAGGQNVNKTESAIRITHIPTGIVVSCQTERSQMQNKETCMKMLKSKLIEKKEQEEQEKLKDIQGSLKKIEWGSQIRSYVFCPYTLVKDHRTNFDNPNVQAVLDGDLQPFITQYLMKKNDITEK